MTHEVTITTSRKEKLAAEITSPDGGSKLAILCPGYLDSKDYEHLKHLADSLASKGYVVVRFDPTGTWESEGSISEYLTSQYLKDIKSILEYMLLKGEYKQVLLAGHSRGGMVSLLYAACDPRITQVIGIMPSSNESHKDQEEWKRTGYRISTRDVPGQSGNREYKVPYAHAVDRNQFDVIRDVKNIHIPITLIAGEKDELVTPSDVKKIYDNANEPKKYIILKGIGHDYRLNPKEIEIVNDLICKELES